MKLYITGKKKKTRHPFKLIMKRFWLNYFKNYTITIILYYAVEKLQFSLHWTSEKILDYRSGRTDLNSPKNYKRHSICVRGMSQQLKCNSYSLLCLKYWYIRCQVVIDSSRATIKTTLSPSPPSKIVIFYNSKHFQNIN